MTHPDKEATPTEEASIWLARMNSRTVDTATVEGFFRWRRDPANKAAYDAVEAMWQAATHLREDQDVARSLSSALVPARPRMVGFRLAAVAAMVLALLSVGLGTYWQMPTRFETRTGEQRMVVLDDGTRVRLNTASEVEVRLTRDERHVALTRGQAFFDVAHDATRPFLVDSGTARVRAVGTRFDVRRDAGATLVTLVQGRVRVRADVRDPASYDGYLSPGEMQRIRAGAAGPVQRVDARLETSWITGRLEFDRTPLVRAIGEMNRYTDHPLVLDAPALAGERISGGFDTSDMAGFVAAITAVYPVRTYPTRDGGTRLAP